MTKVVGRWLVAAFALGLACASDRSPGRDPGRDAAGDAPAQDAPADTGGRDVSDVPLDTASRDAGPARDAPPAKDPCFSDCVLARIPPECLTVPPCHRERNDTGTVENHCFDDGVRAQTTISQTEKAGALFDTVFRAKDGTVDCYRAKYLVEGFAGIELYDAKGALFATGSGSGADITLTCGTESQRLDLLNPVCRVRIHGGVFGECPLAACAYP